MDWKSTAVISGAGILATWFFSMPGTQSPAVNVRPSAPTTRAGSTRSSSIDIQEEAARLQGRIRTESRYTQPVRNPFRFGERPRPAQRAESLAPGQPVDVAPLPPPPPRLLLDGIATDVVAGQEQRIAVLNTDAGVVLAREGEMVAGYRVEKIGVDAVDLVKVSDGSPLHIAFR